jgi:CheY-like chemotaxis protein
VTLPRGADASAGQRCALVVEDDPDVQQLLHTHLRRLGWDVRVVGSGEAALDEAFARTPDLVVLDVLLPGIDGRDVVRALRHHAPTRACPVVVTTVLDAEDLEELALDGVLPKPFSRADVERVVSALPIPSPALPDAPQERS